MKLSKKAVAVKPVTNKNLAALVKNDKNLAALAKNDDIELAASKAATKRICGKTLGMSVGQTWVHLFQENEILSVHHKRTDQQITEFLMKEFPDRASKTFNFPQHYRRMYNIGIFTKDVPPTKQSVKFAPEAVKKEVVRNKVAGTKDLTAVLKSIKAFPVKK